jgi:hypothetical protein
VLAKRALLRPLEAARSRASGSPFSRCKCLARRGGVVTCDAEAMGTVYVCVCVCVCVCV